jgi:hypothetical protein
VQKVNEGTIKIGFVKVVTVTDTYIDIVTLLGMM